jgi:hypothetical protein
MMVFQSREWTVKSGKGIFGANERYPVLKERRKISLIDRYWYKYRYIQIPEN